MPDHDRQPITVRLDRGKLAMLDEFRERQLAKVNEQRREAGMRARTCYSRDRSIEDLIPDKSRTSKPYAEDAQRLELNPAACYTQSLNVEFVQVSITDRTGMVNIDARGAENWSFADIGSHVGMQSEHDGEDREAMELAKKIAELVRDHYAGKVKPLSV